MPRTHARAPPAQTRQQRATKPQHAPQDDDPQPTPQRADTRPQRTTPAATPARDTTTATATRTDATTSTATPAAPRSTHNAEPQPTTNDAPPLQRCCHLPRDGRRADARGPEANDRSRHDRRTTTGGSHEPLATTTNTLLYCLSIFKFSVLYCPSIFKFSRGLIPMNNSTPDTLNARVNTVCAYMLEDRRTDRNFDSCFEMYDGDIVAVAIYRRAQNNNVLQQRLYKYLCIHATNNAVTKYQHCTDDDLPSIAQQLRKRGEENAERRFREMIARQDAQA